MSDVCTEILLIKMILESLGIKVKTPITVHCDNVGSIFLSYNAKISQRTKHIDSKHRFVGEYVEQGIVKIVFIEPENNIADIMTKNTNEFTFNKHKEKLIGAVEG